MHPRKYGLRTVPGHEVAPVTFSPRSKRKENQEAIRQQAAEANESFPTKEQKMSIIKSTLNEQNRQRGQAMELAAAKTR